MGNESSISQNHDRIVAISHESERNSRYTEGSEIMENQKKPVIEILHIFTFSGLAFAQPLYDILGKNADLFIFRKATPFDVILLSAVLSLLIPLFFIALKTILRGINERWEKIYYKVITSLLFVLIFLPIIKRMHLNSWYFVFPAGIIASFLVTLLYFRFERISSFFTVLSPASLVFPFLFLLNSPVFSITSSLEASRSVAAGIEKRPPIVLIVFDEFPTISLLNKNLEIDAVRYPNFASFARDAYWFRNATTVHNLTDVAVPAILTGRYPTQEKKLSIVNDYPENLFTLLSGSYNNMNIFETATRLCPASLCKTTVSRKPAGSGVPELLKDTGIIYLLMALPRDIIEGNEWLNRQGNEVSFWSKIDQSTTDRHETGNDSNPLSMQSQSSRRIKQYNDFLDSISDRPGSLYFLHTLLPHVPYIYLPSGKQYTEELVMPGWDWQKDQWADDKLPVVQAYRRHLLQVEFTDRLIHSLVKRLKEVGIYDESLIVLTADHGISFTPGRMRRHPDEDTRYEITNVPVFVKLPGQKKGIVSDENIQTIDILPTITSILKIRLPWRMDGESVLEKSGKTDLKYIAGEKFTSSPAGLRPFVERKNELFGTGKLIQLYDTIPGGNGLIGKSVSDFSPSVEPNFSLKLENGNAFNNIDTNSNLVPVYLKGSLTGKAEPSNPVNLAVAVNGVIRSVTQTFEQPVHRMLFTAMVPETSFHSGKNIIKIYRFETGENKIREIKPIEPGS